MRVVRAVLFAVGAILVVGFVTVMLGMPLLLQAPFVLAFGWVMYALDVLPQATMRWDALVVFAGVVAILLTVGHRLVARLASRLTPPRVWTFRDSGVALTVCAALFVALLGVSGLSRQIGWLVTSDDPMTEMHWVRLDPYALRNIALVCGAIRMPPDGYRGPDGRVRLSAIPLAHPTLHAVPLGLDADAYAAAEVLLFPRDPVDLERSGGLLCPGSVMNTREVPLSADDVRARLAGLRTAR